MAIWRDKYKPLDPGTLTATELEQTVKAMQNAAYQHGAGTPGVAAQGTFNNPNTPSLVRQIAMRMHWDEEYGQAYLPPIQRIEAQRVDDKVFIWVVNKGQQVTLEDGWDLFPSNALITKLRLLQG